MARIYRQKMDDGLHRSGFAAWAACDILTGKKKHHIPDRQIGLFRKLGRLTEALTDDGNGVFLRDIGKEPEVPDAHK